MTVGNVMSTFQEHVPKKKKGWYIVTRVTSGNKWSGQSVKNILILQRFALIPSDTFLWGWSIWEMTALCMTEAQILVWWALSGTETGDSLLFQFKVWAIPVTQLSLCFKFARQVTLGKVIPQNMNILQLCDNKGRVCGYAGIKPGCWARTLLSSTVNNWDLTEWVLQPGREGFPLVLSFVRIPTSNKCFIHASKNGLCCDRIRHVPLMCCIKEGDAFTWNSSTPIR